MSVGRLFHTRGAATANARSPNLLHVRGTYRSPLCAVRNEARDGRSATAWRSVVYRHRIQATLTYKVLTTTQPPYLHKLISTQRPRSTRSSSVVTLPFFLPDCLRGLLPGPFLLSYSVFIFSFTLFFVSVPCARLSWP